MRVVSEYSRGFSHEESVPQWSMLFYRLQSCHWPLSSDQLMFSLETAANINWCSSFSCLCLDISLKYWAITSIWRSTPLRRNKKIQISSVPLQPPLKLHSNPSEGHLNTVTLPQVIRRDTYKIYQLVRKVKKNNMKKVQKRASSWFFVEHLIRKRGRHPQWIQVGTT